MAGSPEPVPEVNHGWKGAIFALIFALIIVGGASVATAYAVDQNGYDAKYGEDHGDEYDDHGDEHSDEEHGEDDHADDEDHSDG